MSKKHKYWWFIYFPNDDYITLVGDPTSKSFSETVAYNLSGYGQEELRSKDWKSFCIDVDVTNYWRKAYEIAAKHFNTKNPYDLNRQIADVEDEIRQMKQERHSKYLKTSSRIIKGYERYLKRMISEREKISDE